MTILARGYSGGGVAFLGDGGFYSHTGLDVGYFVTFWSVGSSCWTPGSSEAAGSIWKRLAARVRNPRVFNLEPFWAVGSCQIQRLMMLTAAGLLESWRRLGARGFWWAMSGDAPTDWRKLFAAGIDQELEFFPPTVVEGSCVVKPPKELFEEGILDWKHALVGQFIGSAPSFSSIQKIVTLLWSKASPIKVSLAGPNLYVFSFTNSNARDWVLENGMWHVQHKLIFLRKWEPNLKELQFDLCFMPIWIHLFNVPLELFSKRGLSYIASAIGKPLHMDSVIAARDRLEYARVCVEVHVGSSIHDHIDVVPSDESVVRIRVSVPWIPSSCTDCGQFGHSDAPSASGKAAEDVGCVVATTFSEALEISSGKKNLVHMTIRNDLAKVVDATIGNSFAANSVPNGNCLANNSAEMVDVVKQAEQSSNPPVKRGRGRPAKKGWRCGKPSARSELKKKEHVDKVKRIDERGVYGSNDSSILKQLWTQLNSMEASVKSRAWLIEGLWLFDHPFTGPLFTWTNKQQDTFLALKLDRVLVNSNWIEAFPASDVEFQAPGDSDHGPALVWLHKEISIAMPKPFKDKREKLKSLQLANLDSSTAGRNIHGEVETEKELKALEEAEMLFYKQKTKVDWIKDGDQGTRFFHSMVASKRKSNAIRVLFNQSGERLNTFDAMSNEVVGFFVNQLGWLTLRLRVAMLAPSKSYLAIFCQGMQKTPNARISLMLRLRRPCGDKGTTSPLVQMVQESLDYSKRRLPGSNQGAFDSLNWEFVDVILHALGLPDKGARGVFGYHPKCKRIGLTHLFFADDLLIFCKGSIDSIMGVQAVLDHFYFMSGLKLNASKCEIYLGVTLVTKKLAVKDCQALIDKLRAKLSLWANKRLSFAGRNADFWQMEIPTNASWSFKYLLKIRPDVAHLFSGQFPGRIPKFSIIAWMSMLNRLPTRVWLVQIGLTIETDKCLLCGTVAEIRDRLFFECSFVKELWGFILELCGISRGASSWDGELAWATRLFKSKSLIMRVLKLAWTGHVYDIWMERNNRLFGRRIISKEDMLGDIKQTIRIRLQDLSFNRIDSSNVVICDKWGIA
ncbi:hypothetical protein F3Y22_tig00117048pilonHSYRG00574 [Hibiscus syriacus]|uniref:DUF4283 domain-containing protein n=1 Tax=Hibiscus syriacus TaxID=106335 RepID=A0A6A2X7Y4_HIBSY|nr:hypothetical protein F3Y22_tig00117048pilonHSYRG00574 [Hibiscus syriacus]